MDDYGILNEVLVRLFRDIMDIEEKAIITSEYQDITNNDMHVIEAIGIGAPKNMSAIAKELSVTVGSAYAHHSRFHKEMIDALMEKLDGQEKRVLIQALTKLDQWFRKKEYENRME